MLTVSLDYQPQYKQLQQKIQRGNERALFRMGGYIRNAAKFSIKRRTMPKKIGIAQGQDRESYRMNFRLVTCTCDDFKFERSRYKKNDPARLCKHLRSNQAKIKKAQVAAKGSPKGTPPYSYRPRQVLRRSIKFEVDKTLLSVDVGAGYRDTDAFAEVHEKGGTRRGKRYPKRAFMVPALIDNLPKIPDQFSNMLN